MTVYYEHLYQHDHTSPQIYGLSIQNLTEDVSSDHTALILMLTNGQYKKLYPRTVSIMMN